MKRYIFLIVIFALFLLFFCTKENKIKKSLILSKTELSGCFKDAVFSKGTENDTAYFIIENDTLIMHLGLNYNCCGKLADNIILNNNEIFAYLKDTCTIGECDCKCTCYYIFDFKFINYNSDSLDYNVFLKRYQSPDYKLIITGTNH